MTERRSVKERKSRPRLVGVIASRADLELAARLRRPPDLFELRLDALHPLTPEKERLIAALTAPLIITARHPQEGGRHDLSAGARRALLRRFLPLAKFVDVELRSCQPLHTVLEAAAEQAIPRIISVHHLASTPTLRELEKLLAAAESLRPDIFKLVTRTDSAAALARMLTFFDQERGRVPMAVMGIGRFGLESRRALWRRGSVLQYVHLGTAVVPGQLSLAAARRLPTLPALPGPKSRHPILAH